MCVLMYHSPEPGRRHTKVTPLLADAGRRWLDCWESRPRDYVGGGSVPAQASERECGPVRRRGHTSTSGTYDGPK